MNEFDNIIGYEAIKRELKRFCDVLKDPEKYERLGVKIPSGILLYGEPGLGKTLMAKCFIKESGRRAFTLRKEKPNGDFVNEIRDTFEKAKQESPAIVFLDDMDKFANEDNMHRDAEEYVAVQSCIDDSKGYRVFTLATVNDKYCMPDSLLRAGRFDKVIELETPKGKDAELIIEHFLDEKKVIGEVDVEEISRIMEGNSCAELETVINEAGIYAGYSGKERIEQSDLVKACMRMIFDAPECIDESDEKNTKIVAVHEAGHAVVAEVLDPGSVTLVSVCRHSGSKEGVTKTHHPDRYSLKKEMEEHDIIGTLAGKAATEMIYGFAELGCGSDLGRAFDIVSTFVDTECMFGFEAYERGNPSGYLLEKKDRIIAFEVNRYYQEAKKIIAENRRFLDEMVAALMENQTITYKDIQEIKQRIYLSNLEVKHG